MSETIERRMQELLAKQAVAEVVQQWGRARDQGLWEDLARTFHPGGMIKTMWFDGLHSDFITACAARFEVGKGVTKHFFGVSVVKVRGERALSETPAFISMTGEISGVRFTGTSFLRFLDRCELRDGEWRIVKRTGIYEGDRLETERPVELDREILERYTPQYRYLAYRQHRSGRKVHLDTPTDGSELLVTLMREADAWLG
jgi:hypothetical protein